MPSMHEYSTAKAQAESFIALNCSVVFEMQPMASDAAPAIKIARGSKSWRFSDPDWGIVIAQMAQLYKTLRGK